MINNCSALKIYAVTVTSSCFAQGWFYQLGIFIVWGPFGSVKPPKGLARDVKLSALPTLSCSLQLMQVMWEPNKAPPITPQYHHQ